jgi:hypothetical protein
MDFLEQYYLGDEIYLFVLFTIMVVAGIAKEHNLFGGTYGYLKSKFSSNRLVIAIISLVSGILPLEGRSTISAGILDTATASHEKDVEARQKLGPIDFLTTHHYYMWSPIEKPVILPMAAFGIGYGAWIGMMWPLIAVSAAFILYYLFVVIKEEDVSIEPQENLGATSFVKNIVPFLAAVLGYMALGGEGPELVFPIFGALLAYYLIITKTFSISKISSYVNWTTIAIVGLVFFSSGFMQEHRAWIEEGVKTWGLDPHTFKGMALISLALFGASFSMGSDGKFAALTVLAATVFGKEYLLWFFALDYCGYLLTPMHECVLIGKRYFGTPLLTYYKALGSWAGLILITAGTFTFLI